VKISKTLLFMFRNPVPLIVYLICWFFYPVLHVMSEDPFTDRSWPGMVLLAKTAFSNLPWSLENFAIVLSIIFNDIIKEVIRSENWIIPILFAFIIGYREARGNLKGIAKERQTWMQWYNRQQEVIKQEDSLEQPPSTLEATQANSYFWKAQRTLFSMVRHPMLFVLHFTCWFSPFLVLFLIDRSHVIETTGDLVKIVLYLVTLGGIPALISSYQETRGIVKGISKEGETWAKWHQRQINAVAQGYTLAAPPPSLETS